jgi:hypothetical protein
MSLKNRILELRGKGYTYSQIVTELSCSKSVVSYHCGENQKEKSNVRNRKRKQAKRYWLQQYKESLKCSSCGEDRWWVLDFHHRDPSEKEQGVARLFGCASKERIMKEIEKCDVLCANCHRDLHHRERITKVVSL